MAMHQTNHQLNLLRRPEKDLLNDSVDELENNEHGVSWNLDNYKSQHEESNRKLSWKMPSKSYV